MERKNLHERRFEFQIRAAEIEGQPEAQELWVEGYAVRFNSPTVLFEYDGVEYKEEIMRGAFEGCKMDDVIFNYNHAGKVMARTRNETLTLTTDNTGLFIRARLDGTEEGRRLYDEISKGYIDRMSFRFNIGAEAYDKDEHKWTVTRIKRLWDVSAVDIPAYDDTSIEARRADAEAVARESRQAAEAALLRGKLMLKLNLN